MKSYAGTFICKKCRTYFLLDDEDIKYELSKQMFCFDDIEEYRTYKIFYTYCNKCNYKCKLQGEDISTSAIKNAKEK